jgi:uncharacterized protein (DUF486 family)
MNSIVNYILFTIGLLLSCTFYTIASYYFRFGQENNIKFKYIYLISLAFGLLSYSIKIPTFYFFGKNFKVLFIHIVFLIASFLLVLLYSKFYLKEEVHLHSLIIFTIIILLLVLDNILTDHS